MARIPLNPSVLDGEHRTRVFIGGSYTDTYRPLLDVVAEVVKNAGMVPVIADLYAMDESRLHDVTLYLLHSCRYAVFEASESSGAFMEMERLRDYGTFAFILFHNATGSHLPSRMLDSLVRTGDPQIQFKQYARPINAKKDLKRWLSSMRRNAYGR